MGVAKAGDVDEVSKQEKRKLSVLAYRFWKTFGPSYCALNALNCFSFPFLPRSKHYILGTVFTWSKSSGKLLGCKKGGWRRELS